MRKCFTCVRGHQWDAEVAESANETLSFPSCPSCGEVAQPDLTVEGRKVTGIAAAEQDQSLQTRNLGDKPTIGQETTHSPLQGQTLEGYEIVAELGHGGMGVVYKAYDQKRGVHVALKTLPAMEPRALYRFKQEFRALVDVSHPNLAALYELISVGDLWFFTMELIDGVSFLDYIRTSISSPVTESLEPALLNRTPSRGEQPSHSPTASSTTWNILVEPAAPSTASQPQPAPEARATSVLEERRLREALLQLAEGVRALHDQGKLHRDIKPSNVLVTRAGRVVLLDFGLVTELDDRPLVLTDAPEIAGTVAYMSPEQAIGRDLSPASDWYAVGVMLHEALTGVLPIRGDTTAIWQAKQTTIPERPSTLGIEVPADLDELCFSLLQRNPKDRPSGADVLRILGGKPDEGRGGLMTPQDQRNLFVGREAQLSALREAFQATRQGQTVTVFVHGRSGVGKSALVQRFLDGIVSDENVVVLTGRCYEQESVPYKALDSLVDALSRYLGRISWNDVTHLIPPDIAALARLFPVLRRVGAIVAAVQQTVTISDVHELRRRAFAALRELLFRLGQQHPLLLYIDDLQWGDTDSAALLSELLRPPAPPVLCLLCAYRSEYESRSACLQALLAAHGSDQTGEKRLIIAVEPLDPAATQVLALELLGSDDAAAYAQADAVMRESGGSPYFVHELVQGIREGAELAFISGEKITLDEVLWRRVARLPDSPRKLLEIVTVAGRSLRQLDAYRAADLDIADRAALATLRAGHLARSTGTSAQDEIESYHDRIRESVVAHLTPDCLRARHQGLAITLETAGGIDPETLAIHFQGAGDSIKAGGYYAAAADEAAEALAFDRAAKLYRLALELRPLQGDEGRALRRKLSDALANAGRGAEAAASYLAAAEGADADTALDLRRRAAYQYCSSGHADEGRATLKTVLESVGMKLPATPFRSLIGLLLGRLKLWWRGLKFKERHESEIPRDDLKRVDVTWSTSTGLTIIDIVGAASFQTQNLLLALRAGEPFRLARALAWEAGHSSNPGLCARARTDMLIAMASELAERIGSPYARALILLSRGIGEWCYGNWIPSCTLLDQAEAMFQEHCTGVAWELGTTRSFIMWAFLYRGEFSLMSRRATMLRKDAQQRGDLYTAANIGTYPEAVCRLADDEPEDARRLVHDCLAQWSHSGYHVQHMTATWGNVYTDLYLGDGPSAWQRISEQWPPIKRSHLLRVQMIRIIMYSLHGSSALACAVAGRDVKAMLRNADWAARKMESENTQWGNALALLLRAGIAARQNEHDRVRTLLANAAKQLGEVHMSSYAAAARRRLGKLLTGEQGQSMVREADAWMTSQGIKNPTRMTTLHAPGFAND
jgi:serine/threonine protein kinase